jgi:hypothetical protein
MDCRVKPGNDGGWVSANQHEAVTVSAASTSYPFAPAVSTKGRSRSMAERPKMALSMKL